MRKNSHIKLYNLLRQITYINDYIQTLLYADESAITTENIDSIVKLLLDKKVLIDNEIKNIKL